MTHDVGEEGLSSSITIIIKNSLIFWNNQSINKTSYFSSSSQQQQQQRERERRERECLTRKGKTVSTPHVQYSYKTYVMMMKRRFVILTIILIFIQKLNFSLSLESLSPDDPSFLSQRCKETCEDCHNAIRCRT